MPLGLFSFNLFFLCSFLLLFPFLMQHKTRLRITWNRWSNHFTSHMFVPILDGVALHVTTSLYHSCVCVRAAFHSYRQTSPLCCCCCLPLLVLLIVPCIVAKPADGTSRCFAVGSRSVQFSQTDYYNLWSLDLAGRRIIDTTAEPITQ